MAIIKEIELYVSQEEVVPRFQDKKHRFFGRKPGFTRRLNPFTTTRSVWAPTTEDNNNNNNITWEDCNNNTSHCHCYCCNSV